MFRRSYADVFARRRALAGLRCLRAAGSRGTRPSTYIRKPTFLEGMTMDAAAADGHHRRARAGAARRQRHDRSHLAGGLDQGRQPGRKYLIEKGVKPSDFNSYGARRGNHEVMMRGTFANVRLRNQMAPGTEGGWTRYQPGGELMTIYDASVSVSGRRACRCS